MTEQSNPENELPNDETSQDESWQIPERDREIVDAVRLILQGAAESFKSIYTPLTHLAIPSSGIPKEFEAIDLAFNHLCITVLRDINARHAVLPTLDDGELVGAFNLLNVTAVYNLMKWAIQHPDEARAIEDTIQKRTQPAGHTEETFNVRRREQNVAEVKTALEDWGQHYTPNAPGLPTTVGPTLEAIRQSCQRNLQEDEQGPDNHYYHDSHSDHFTTYVYAKTMLEAINLM